MNQRGAAQLGWRRPAWMWAGASFVLAGPLNPLALVGAAFPASPSDFVSAWLLGACASTLAITVTMLSWLSPQASLRRTLAVLAATAAAGAMMLAIAAGMMLPADAALADRFNLAIAILVMTLAVGIAVAASALAIFRLVALRSRRPAQARPESRTVGPREVAAPEAPRV